MTHMLKTAALSAALAFGMTGAASAAVLTFSDFQATDDATPKSALVSVDDNTSGYFTFTIDLAEGENGTLTGFYADFTGDVLFSESDITSSPDYECFESPGTSSDGVCSNSQNLQGLGDFTFDFGLGYDFAETPVIVQVLDKGLTLDDVLAVGLRFQETGADGESSSKLYSSTVSQIPVPAAGLLLLGGLGGLGTLRALRRKN